MLHEFLQSGQGIGSAIVQIDLSDSALNLNNQVFVPALPVGKLSLLLSTLCLKLKAHQSSPPFLLFQHLYIAIIPSHSLN